MRVSDDKRLAAILAKMRDTISESRVDPAGGHARADDLLLEAARVCGVPRSILVAWEQVEKWYE